MSSVPQSQRGSINASSSRQSDGSSGLLGQQKSNSNSNNFVKAIPNSLSLQSLLADDNNNQSNQSNKLSEDNSLKFSHGLMKKKPKSVITKGNQADKEISFVGACRVPVYNSLIDSLPVKSRYFAPKTDPVTKQAMANANLNFEESWKIRKPGKSIADQTKELNILIIRELQEMRKLHSEKDNSDLNASKAMNYNDKRIKMEILGQIFEKVILGMTVIAPSLCELKREYHELLKSTINSEECSNHGSETMAELKGQVKELSMKLTLADDKTKSLLKSLEETQEKCNKLQNELEKKRDLTIHSAEVIYNYEIPKNIATVNGGPSSKRQFITEWLQQQVSNGYNCTRELAYLNENPDMFRESAAEHGNGVTHSQFKHLASSRNSFAQSLSSFSGRKSIANSIHEHSDSHSGRGTSRVSNSAKGTTTPGNPSLNGSQASFLALKDDSMTNLSGDKSGIGSEQSINTILDKSRELFDELQNK